MERKLIVPIFLWSAVIFVVFQQSLAAVDKTREVQATGVDVVDAVIRKIRRSQIFKDDYDFLRRAAQMETNFGQNSSTFSNPEAAGIWQVTTSMFNITKSPKLKTMHEQIMSKFDIDWKKVKWSDLDKPLHNGIAFRLYLHAIAPNLPETLAKQEQLWKYIYQKKGPVSGQFVGKLGEFDETAGKCRGLFDLTVVMDGSGSIGDEDFVKAKDFIANLFATYSSDSVRKAFILFGDDAYMIFRLDNKLSSEEIQETVKNVTYPAEATNTNAGILLAVDMIKTSKTKARQTGVPSILIVFTDGESNVGDGVSNVKLAKQNNITTFSVGIGPKLNQTELLEIAYNDATHLLLTKDYNTLKSLVNRINAETCLVSQKPSFGEEVDDFLLTQEYRYYEYPVDGRGVIVNVNNTEGKVEGYYSFTEQNPSAAVHDGILNSSVTVIEPPDDFWDRFTSSELDADGAPSSQIFITLQGRKRENNYTIEVNPLNGPGIPKSKRRQNGTSSNSITGSDGLGTDGLNGSGDGKVGTGGSSSGNSDGSTNGGDGNNSKNSNNNANGSSEDSQTDGNGSDKNNGSGTNNGNGSGTNNGNGPNKNGPGGNNGNGNYDTPWPNEWLESAEQSGPTSSGSKGSPDDERRRRKPNPGSGPSASTSFGIPSLNNALPCPERYIGFMEFPGRCDVYTLCTFGIRVLFECAPGLHFDKSLKTCNFIQLANCGGPSAPIPQLGRSNNNNSTTV